MKTMQKFLTQIFIDPKDEPIFNHDNRLKTSRPFHPAPSFWALIPLRIEQIKYPKKDNPE